MTKTRFRLTPAGREWLSKPLGEVISEEGLPALKGNSIIAIGDISAYVLIKAGIMPKVAVFDFKSRRDPVGQEIASLLKASYPSPFEVENPPGTFSDEFFSIARRAIAESRGIFVKGEEDLLGLAFFVEAPEGWLVIYGQERNFVVVRITKEFKEEVLRNLPKALSAEPQA